MQRDGSIQNRLIAIILFITFITALIGYSTFVYWYMQNQYDRTLKIAQTVGDVLGQDFTKLILLDDVSVAADISSSLHSFSNLNKMVLYNQNDKPILQYSKENKSFKVDPLPPLELRKMSVDGNILTLYTIAKYQNRHLGYVQFQFEIETIVELIRRNSIALLLILGGMFIVSSLLTLYFAKRFTNPILKLVDFLESIGSKETMHQRVFTTEKNEYGKLYDEVNKMLERIEDSHEAMKIAAVAFETQNGMTITDKDQKILQVNNAFKTITGYSQDEVIGKSPRILQSGLHNKEFYNEMKTQLKEKGFWSGEIINRHKKGNVVHEHLTIQSVVNDEGEVLYYVASFVDITLLKKTEAKLKEKESQLIQKSKMAEMGEMLENIAHQWKQPLSIMSTIASTISFQKSEGIQIDSKDEIEQLDKINDTVQYLSHTIDDFRKFFKPDKTTTQFNLKDCYLRVLNLIKPKLESMDIVFVENIQDVEVNTLQNELIQVVINILNNAKDQLQAQNKEIKLIIIEIYSNDEFVSLSIKDNAGGIPDDIIERIFDPYFTTKEDNDGTGIGLYMAMEMVTKHMYGKLTVENDIYKYEGKVHKGANFTITLPKNHTSEINH